MADKFDPSAIIERADPDVRPRWSDEGVPYCGEDELPRCPWWDGKRCGATGMRPGTVCEPMVRDMAWLLDARIREVTR